MTLDIKTIYIYLLKFGGRVVYIGERRNIYKVGIQVNQSLWLWSQGMYEVVLGPRKYNESI